MKVNLKLGIPLFVSFLFTITILLIPKFLPNHLPLFYSLPWGESEFATPLQFLFLPAIIVIVTLLNFLISKQLHHQQVLFKQVLIYSTYLLTLILVLTFIKIVMIFV